MAKSKRNLIVPTDELAEPLRQIYYLVGKHPLHKLIESGYLGAPGYTELGQFNSRDEGKHLSVRLGANYDFYYKQWFCWIRITDADDLHLSIHKEFTEQNWTELMSIYTSLYIIDKELLCEFD